MTHRLPKVLCIGVDVTWWGGSPKKRASQSETIVSAALGGSDDLSIGCVDLGRHKNPLWKNPTEPNFDAKGEALCRAIEDLIGQHVDVDWVLVALDAPLKCCHRPNQPPPRKAVPKGAKKGSEQRQAERELADYRKRPDPARHKGWNADLRIQAGSPIPIRIARIVEALSCPSRANLVLYVAGGSWTPRGLVEIFPSEAVWALGISGNYRLTSSEVRAYKAKKPYHLGIDEARVIARRPLAGFLRPLTAGGLSSEVANAWIDRIVEEAVGRASTSDGRVRKSKAFDDPIDSGIAFLTAVACAVGEFHVWGDGSDGTIVGPGRLSGSSRS